MTGPPGFTTQGRGNPFQRNTSASLASNGGSVRPKSVMFASPQSHSLAAPTGPSHNRSRSQSQSQSPSQSQSLATPASLVQAGSVPRHGRERSRESTPVSGTFAPSFINTEEMKRRSIDVVRGIEGENDFSGKRYVWVKDPQAAFVKGWVVEEMGGNRMLVQCEDGSQREVDAESVDKVNPAKFDKANDMAELTHLNEASVVHNLHMRYQADLIYTYSGLFLVTVNPYCPLPIYTNEYVNMYKGRSRDDTKPHIFAMADEAFRNLVDEGENQSILVTGESGAGKTENTKKVIQYLAAVAHGDAGGAGKRGQHANLSAQILRANPILEAFGNAQTVRNNNSSRFGKFIRIEFSHSGAIAGAFIDWYLLEKSRVVHINRQERNYHIFYQLLRGADRRLRQQLLLEGLEVEDFAYTREGNDVIAGVSDQAEWEALMEAFAVMGFAEADQTAILRTVAAVLHLGNLAVAKESRGADQARLTADSKAQAATVCRLLGVPAEPFLQGLLHPRVKAGREWVEKVQTPEQVRLSIDALAKGLYERGFGDLVTRINGQLDRAGTMGMDDGRFIGVLDIAGFEIFEENSFEQLCINYTNEKLQQFFNHHMFVLEQEEYAREQIEWQFIDFGRDLQPTIDLIELSNPIGLFSCLDEDCVMPKATDKSFTEKLHALWEKKSPKYRAARLRSGFVLTHYAAEVEYSTENWLEKNKDPLNDNITRLLAASTDAHVAKLFADCADQEDDAVTVAGRSSRVKKGLFRTVAQRHKEQLSKLMAQLHATHPHFVRCILPNHKKRPKQFQSVLVLDQLRCNGVLEGIRIARTGFPNRLPFAEFRQRYEVLCRGDMPKGCYLEGQAAAGLMLAKLGLDPSLYRVGLTKVFFRSGVLAELEEQRDALISEIMGRFQAVARGFSQRRIAYKRLYRAEATRVIQRSFHAYLDLSDSPWWQLLVKMRPLLGATRTATEVRRRDETIRQLTEQMQQQVSGRQKVEDERRAALAEMGRIQQTLESERALALDKEEIFKRLQQREAELADKLAGALEDQERLDAQLDALLAAKKRAEDEVERCRGQLEQAAGLIARLEGEKQAAEERVAAAEARERELDAVRAQGSAQEAALAEEVKVLQSQLAIRERKSRDLESRLLDGEAAAQKELAATQKELAAARAAGERLAAEHGAAQQRLAQLSQTSTDYEDLVRQKESELALARSDNKRYEAERQALDEQRRALAQEKEQAAAKLRNAQAEVVAMRSQEQQLQREAADAQRLLAARLSQDAQAAESRRVVEAQIKDLKEALYGAQTELSRERQSRDDVLLLGEHKYQTLEAEHEHLNQSKIIIEKEMYAQQDTLRRATEARKAIEAERDEARQEVRRLRAAKAAAEEARIEEATRQQAQGSAQEAALRRELEAAQAQVADGEAERGRLAAQVEELNRLMVASGEFGLKNDQAKERLEREVATVKSRLAASENDNRALLNKLQQKGLEIARSTSRAGEAARGQVITLQREKARLEGQLGPLQQQLSEAQMAAATLEKKVEKLSLDLEDMQHEVAREVKTSRHAEKVSANATAQLAELHRAVEAERQLRGEAQAKLRAAQAAAAEEVQVLRSQLAAATTTTTTTVTTPPRPTVARMPDSARSDRTADMHNHMNHKAEVEELQNQLQLAQMQNRHLQSQLERAAPRPDGTSGDAVAGRVQKLEQANSRLHAQLDDSARKVSALEKALRSGELSLHDLQTRSHEEILELLNSQEAARRTLVHQHKDVAAELAEVKGQFERMRHERARLEVDARDARSEVQELDSAREQEAASRQQLLQEFADLQMRLDAEAAKAEDATASLQLYKGRADEYYGKLEQAEMAVLKASRAEQFARAQAAEAEETCATVMAARQKMEATVEELQRSCQRLEERLEDASTDLAATAAAKKRLQHELEDYRNQRAMDIEDTETSMEQTRRKYQAEFATLSKELDLAREAKLAQQAEMARLREELDGLRSKWDDEVLNSSTWAKEKTRLETTLADVVASRDEAAQAHSEAQGRVVSLLSQVRALRTAADEASAERDAALREKRSTEARLAEAKAGLEELAAQGASPSLRSAAHADKAMLDLRASLAQQEDVAAAAVEKMRRAEALVAEVQKDMAAERESSARLQADKAGLEKALSEVQVRLVDLETKGYSSASQDIKFLHKRIQELESTLEAREQEQAQSQRSVRNVDRTVKDLQSQLDRKDKQNGQLQDDVARLRDKADKLLKTIDELQASESSLQLTARRADRELREEKERGLRLERELETWKAGVGGSSVSSASAAGSIRRSLLAHTASTATSRTGFSDDDIPKRKSSIGRTRAPSLTKGFL